MSKIESHMVRRSLEQRPTLTIMRGLPGAGKTTAAHEGAELQAAWTGDKVAVISTDDYFMAGDVYLFDRAELSDAHEWNLRRLKKLLACGYNVFLDNTNVRLWNMKEPVEAAIKADYNIDVVTVSDDPEACFRRCRHSIPLNAFQAMQKGWQDLPDPLKASALQAILEAGCASSSPAATSRRPGTSCSGP